MPEQHDEHNLVNSVMDVAKIINRLLRLVSDSMNRNGLFSFLSKEFRVLFHYDRFSIFLYDAECEALNAFTPADGTVVEGFLQYSCCP